MKKKPIFQGDHRQNMDIVWNPRVPRPRDNTVESKSVPLSFCHFVIGLYNVLGARHQSHQPGFPYAVSDF